MKFAYADPPYPGQAKRWYGNHRDYDGEVDYAHLIDRIMGEYPDGWALSTSAAALREVLIMCPADVRVAIWNRPNSEPPGNRGRWHWMWEPLIVRGGRQKYGDAPAVRDLLTCSKPQGLIPGEKPPAFTRWMIDLLGYREGDDLDDLFPGSKAITKELAQGILL